MDTPGSPRRNGLISAGIGLVVAALSVAALAAFDGDASQLYAGVLLGCVFFAEGVMRAMLGSRVRVVQLLGAVVLGGGLSVMAIALLTPRRADRVEPQPLEEPQPVPSFELLGVVQLDGGPP